MSESIQNLFNEEEIAALKAGVPVAKSLKATAEGTVEETSNSFKSRTNLINAGVDGGGGSGGGWGNAPAPAIDGTSVVTTPNITTADGENVTKGRITKVGSAKLIEGFQEKLAHEQAEAKRQAELAKRMERLKPESLLAQIEYLTRSVESLKKDVRALKKAQKDGGAQ